MRRTPWVVLVAAMLVSCAGYQPVQYITDLQQENLRGPVTRLVTETYRIDSPDLHEQIVSVIIEIFNEQGYTITDTLRDFSEKKEDVNFLHYNTNGSLATMTSFENGKKASTLVFQYEGNQCTSMKTYGPMDSLESFYDHIKQTKYGLLSGLNSYDAHSVLTMSYANTYDSIYQTSAIAKDNKGRLVSTTTIRLTAKKDPATTLEVNYFKDSTVQHFLSYQYEKWDAAGNWTAQIIFDDKAKTTKIVKRIFSYRQ